MATETLDNVGTRATGTHPLANSHKVTLGLQPDSFLFTEEQDGTRPQEV